MTIVTRGGNSLAGFILVAALHLLAFYLLLQDHFHAGQAPASRYSRLVFIQAPRKPVVAEIPTLPATPVTARLAPPSRPAAAIPPDIVNTIAVPEPIEKPAPIDNAGSFPEPARLDIDSLVRQAGKADRETRPVNEIHTYGPTPDSIEAVMTRAFTAAKLAVPLKWYEAARIELFSAPNDPKKIYQVKTAFGTYCLFYPSIYEDSGGGAAARQPKVTSCPRRFGRGAK